MLIQIRQLLQIRAVIKNWGIADPTAMRAYAVGVTPLLHFLQESIMVTVQISKEVAVADDFTVTGKVEEIKSYWDMLQQVGPLHGYFPKPSKSYLIDKEHFHENAKETFKSTEVKLTTEDKMYLGAVTVSALTKKPS